MIWRSLTYVGVKRLARLVLCSRHASPKPLDKQEWLAKHLQMIPSQRADPGYLNKTHSQYCRVYQRLVL